MANRPGLRSWLLTFGALALYQVGRRLPLPGLDYGDLTSDGLYRLLGSPEGERFYLYELLRGDPLNVLVGSMWPTGYSLFGLGLFWLVIIHWGMGLFQVPDGSSPGGRRVGAFLIYLGVTVLVAIDSVLRLERLGEASSLDLVTDVGWASRLLLIASLVGGGAVIWLLASWITRAGIGQGAFVLLGFELLLVGVGDLAALPGRFEPGLVGLLVALLFAVGSACPLVVIAFALWLWPVEWPARWARRVSFLSPLDVAAATFVPSFVVGSFLLQLGHFLPARLAQSATADWFLFGSPLLSLAVAIVLAISWSARSAAAGPRRTRWLLVALTAAPFAGGALLGGWMLGQYGEMRRLTSSQPSSGSIYVGNENVDVVLTTTDGPVGPVDGPRIVGRLEEMEIPSVAAVETEATRIVIRLGGVRNTGELMSLVLHRHLALHGVVEDPGPLRPRPGDQPPPGVSVQNAGSEQARFVAADREPLVRLLSIIELPPGQQAGIECTTLSSGEQQCTPLLIQAAPEMVLDDVSEALVAFDDQLGEPYVAVSLGERGTTMFARVTERFLSRRLALVRGDQVLFAPVVQEPVTGGSVRITMGSSRPRAETLAECRGLAATLRSGVLQGSWSLAELRHR